MTRVNANATGSTTHTSTTRTRRPGVTRLSFCILEIRDPGTFQMYAKKSMKKTRVKYNAEKKLFIGHSTRCKF
jgi:hypothetical protein